MKKCDSTVALTPREKELFKQMEEIRSNRFYPHKGKLLSF